MFPTMPSRPSSTHKSISSISQSELSVITAIHQSPNNSAYCLSTIPPVPVIPPPSIPTRQSALLAPTTYNPLALPTHELLTPPPTFESLQPSTMTIFPPATFKSLPSLIEIPILPHNIEPPRYIYGKHVIQVTNRKVRAIPEGRVQWHITPERRIAMGDWIWIPGMGLATIENQVMMRGKYVALQIIMHGKIPVGIDTHKSEFFVWMDAWPLKMTILRRLASMREWIMGRKFTLYDA